MRPRSGPGWRPNCRPAATCAAFLRPARQSPPADDLLPDLALADAAILLGVPLSAAAVVDTAVTHWPGGLPLGRLGHAAAVARLRNAAATRQGLAVVGSALAGTGLAAVIADARSVVQLTLPLAGPPAHRGQDGSHEPSGHRGHRPRRRPDRRRAAQCGQTHRRGDQRAVVYTAFAVYSRAGDLDAPADKATAELVDLVAELAERGVTLRGFYDVSALRADADLMVWWHAADRGGSCRPPPGRCAAPPSGRSLTPSWSAMGLHRPAEFNKGHVPAFLAGAAAKNWATVYPFVRSYEWYLLPDAERRGMLVEHGMMGREYDQVLSNTVAAFALGDYEWLLALEADELHDTVDLMRHLRASGARMHVREEVPFFSGRRVDEAGVVEVLL